jgi:hypothetical protein
MPAAAHWAADLGAAMRGDDPGGDGAVAGGDEAQELDPCHALAKLVIHQEEVGEDPQLLDQVQRLFAGGCVEHGDAPLFEEEPKRAAQILVVFHEEGDAVLGGGAGAAAGLGFQDDGLFASFGARHLDHEAGAASDARGEAERVAEQRAGAFNDGKAKAHALGGRGTGVQAVELAEDGVLILFGDAGAGVPDFQPDGAAVVARSHEDAAAFGVADGVADEVLQDAAQIGGVGQDHGRAGQHGQAQALGGGDGGEFIAQLAQEAGEVDRADGHGGAAAFQFRDVEKRGENRFDRGERVLRLDERFSGTGRHRLVLDGGHEELGGG